MTETKSTQEARETRPDHEAGGFCAGGQGGKTLALTLLAAAVLVPMILIYLRNCRSQRRKTTPQARDNQADRDQATSAQRITLPSQAAVPDDRATDQVGTGPAPFMGSNESDRFHVPGCRWAQNIAPENQITFASREAAREAGYIACQTCRP